MTLYLAFSREGFGVGYLDPQTSLPTGRSRTPPLFVAGPSTQLRTEADIDELAYTVRFRQLVGCEMVDAPRCGIRVDYRAPRGFGAFTIEPPRPFERWTPEPDPKREVERELYARICNALLHHIATHAPGVRVKRGWLDAPVVPFTPEDELPRRAMATVAVGAFRTHAGVATDVIADRTFAPFESLLLFMASRPERPWRHMPRAYSVTTERLFIERRSGAIDSLPLETLRDQAGFGGPDTVYLFGRDTCVILPGDPRCPVRAELNRRVAALLAP